MSEPICYGDIVYIDLAGSILYSSGFYEPYLYLVSRENIAMKSFRNGLFKICPNFTYKDMGQVEQLKNQLDLLKSLDPNKKVAADKLDNDIKNERKTII